MDAARTWYGTTQACAVCGNVFTKAGPNHRYCHDRCRKAALRAMTHPKPSPRTEARIKRAASERRKDDFDSCIVFHELIDKALAKYKTFRQLSEACGVKISTLAQWANREVLPMPGSRIKFELWAEDALHEQSR